MSTLRTGSKSVILCFVQTWIKIAIVMPLLLLHYNDVSSLFTSSTSPLLNCPQHQVNAFSQQEKLHRYPPKLYIVNNKKFMSRDAPGFARVGAALDSEKTQHRETPISSSVSLSSHRSSLVLEEIKSILQFSVACMTISILLISWEDISSSHPMRQQLQQQQQRWGLSTIKGMGFGSQERVYFSVFADLESAEFQNLPSYNEVMKKHRTERIPLWNNKGRTQQMITTTINKENVVDAVRTIQLALLQLQEMKRFALDYEWEKLEATINDQLFHDDLAKSCYVLKQATPFLSQESRNVIGFDWGSCAWRHCGALADIQEALDEIDSLIGVLEPFECCFCLDIVERSLRDILEVTKDYQDSPLSTQIPVYQPIQRMSDVNEEELDGFDAELIDTLSLFRNTEAE
jgi:hypothetical protein